MGNKELKKPEGSAGLFCGVISVSDKKGHIKDTSGKIIIDSLSAAGHKPLYYKIVMNEKEAIFTELWMALEQEGISAVIINGGTGIREKDVTIEAAKPLFEKRLSGFGELFCKLNFDEIGSSAYMFRAAAAVAAGKIIFIIPGSDRAVKLAMEKLIIPELSNIHLTLTSSSDEKEEIPCIVDQIDEGNENLE